jgi:type II secretory pathway component GspD/PulD (secretin)
MINTKKQSKMSVMAILLLISLLAGHAVSETEKNNPFEVMRDLVIQQAQLANNTAQISPRPGSQITPQLAEEMPELFVETVMLKFLRAENIMKAIQNLVAPYGSIATDSETNTLIVSGTREQVDNVLEQVRKADRTPRQIMVEVVILEVQLDDDNEIGVDWNEITFGRSDRTQTYKHEIIPALTTGMTYGFIADGIDITIKALQEKRDFEILASPKVLVVSGQTARFKTAEEIPYQEVSQTSAGGELTFTKFKDVGITLEVTAIITDDGKILITANPSQSVKTGESNANVPVVDNREISTTLIMKDGQVVVMGGLRSKQETLTIDSVPLLCDIPVVGALFRSEKRETSNSELVIMLSPHIYDDEVPMTDYQLERFNELKKQPPLQFPGNKPKMIENIEAVGGVIEDTGSMIFNTIP